jgi:hypothetical protein
MRVSTFRAGNTGQEYSNSHVTWLPAQARWKVYCSTEGMAIEIVQMQYRYSILDDEPSTAAAALETLSELGIELVGFSEFPHGPGTAQLDLIAEDSDKLSNAAARMGLSLSRKKTGFLIRGEDEPAAVIAEILRRLAEAHIGVTSLQAVSAGAGRFGALLWVKAEDVEEADKALGASMSQPELVYETAGDSLDSLDVPAVAAVPVR